MFKKTAQAAASHVDEKGARTLRNKFRMAGLSVATAGVLVWGVGYASTGNAAWITTGTGTAATVTAGTTAALTVVGITPASGLQPNTNATSTFKVHNPNPFAVKITAASVTGYTLTGGKTPANCDTAAKAGLSPTMDGTAVDTIIPGNGDTSALTITTAMSNLSDDGCQSVVATPNVSVSGVAN